MRSWLLVAGLALVLAQPARAQHPQHDHEHREGPQIHSHRGPGPHYIDAFFTENAYLERKVRPDLLAATGDAGDRYSLQVELEWAFARRASLVAHVPLMRVMPEGLPQRTGIGDISLGPKLALLQSRSAIVSAGADVTIPTGSAARGLGKDQWVTAPFLLAWAPFGPERRWLIQTSAHADLPLVRDPERHLETGAALSWTSPLGVTPMLEGLAEVPLDGHEATSWAVAPGVRWEFAPAWEAGAAVRLRLGGPREETTRLVLGLIRHFPLPRWVRS